MHSSKSIDLAKKNTSLSDEIIKWALSFGRLLIILVEIVAFAAFIYRFTLDRQIVDLNDKIEDKQAIINSLSESEKDFRNLHERLATVRFISTEGNNKQRIMNDILAITPGSLTYSSFIIDKDQLLVEVNLSNNVPALSEFLDSLKNYDQINSVSIVGVENSSGTNTVKITIQAKLNGGTEE